MKSSRRGFDFRKIKAPTARCAAPTTSTATPILPSPVLPDIIHAGRRLDLFNRRRIQGFHGWGLESPGMYLYGAQPGRDWGDSAKWLGDRARLKLGEGKRPKAPHTKKSVIESQTMKPRHGAALALVGWYLMIPPLNSEGKVVTHAPISRWYQFMSFDAASACQQVLSELNSRAATEAEFEQAHASALRTGHQPPLNREEMTRRMTESLCIATDDPRLKEK